jgi:hypothetical protein
VLSFEEAGIQNGASIYARIGNVRILIIYSDGLIKLGSHLSKLEPEYECDCL